MYSETKYYHTGDSAILVEFGNEISYEIHKQVRAMEFSISQSNIEGILETVPTYRSILIYVDPLIIHPGELVKELRILEEKLANVKLPAPKLNIIPTLYGGEYGPDLDDVARLNNLTPDQVISIHSSVNYLIYFLGFTPGFPLLGGMSKSIITPRLDVPRVKVPAGSVGIGGIQTGIYPVTSPGGWRIIGKTPLKLYNPTSQKPILLEAGNYLRFKPITEKKFHEIGKLVEEDLYKPEIEEMNVSEVQ